VRADVGQPLIPQDLTDPHCGVPREWSPGPPVPSTLIVDGFVLLVSTRDIGECAGCGANTDLMAELKVDAEMGYRARLLAGAQAPAGHGRRGTGSWTLSEVSVRPGRPGKMESGGGRE